MAREFLHALVPATLRHASAEVVPQVIADQVVETLLEPLAAPALQSTTASKVLVMSLEAFDELAHALTARSRREEHGYGPVGDGRAKLERGADRERRTIGAFAIGLVDHEQVADLHESGLH